MTRKDVERMKKRCGLCGGKLKDGICTECGMDNRKSDEMYRNAFHQSDCGEENLSHVHEEDGEKAYRQPELNKNRQKKQWDSSKKNKQMKFSTKTAKDKGKLTVFLGIVVALVIAASSLFQGSKTEIYSEVEGMGVEEEQYVLDDYDPYYEEEAEKLRETGESWADRIGAGIYLVGYDLPEGEYTLTGDEGMRCELHDKTHGISEWNSFGTNEYEVESVEDLPFFDGAVVMIDGGGTLELVTENGQLQEQKAKAANPLTQEVLITGEGEAGKDFPAGVYDIQAVEDFGTLELEIFRTPREEYPLELLLLMDEAPTEEYPSYASEYKNVVLTEGSRIVADSVSVKLTPSEGVISEDYFSFYNNI